MIEPTCHLRMPFRRYCRSRALSREVPESPTRSWSSHCLTISAIEADARLQTRLENQSVFIQTADGGAWNDVSSSGRACWVAFTNGELTVKLLSWVDICCSAASIGSVGCGCNSWYDWTLNAVSTAEKRPACPICHCQNEPTSPGKRNCILTYTRRVSISLSQAATISSW